MAQSVTTEINVILYAKHSIQRVRPRMRAREENQAGAREGIRTCACVCMCAYSHAGKCV